MKYYLREFEYKAQLEIFTKFNKPFWTLHIIAEKYYLLHNLVENIISLVQMVTIIFSSRNIRQSMKLRHPYYTYKITIIIHLSTLYRKHFSLNFRRM